eukprot:XP_001700371.1 predicted protein [Chlamydomonas reinhardtii]
MDRPPQTWRVWPPRAALRHLPGPAPCRRATGGLCAAPRQPRLGRLHCHSATATRQMAFRGPGRKRRHNPLRDTFYGSHNTQRYTHIHV